MTILHFINLINIIRIILIIIIIIITYVLLSTLLLIYDDKMFDLVRH